MPVPLGALLLSEGLAAHVHVHRHEELVHAVREEGPLIDGSLDPLPDVLPLVVVSLDTRIYDTLI